MGFFLIYSYLFFTKSHDNPSILYKPIIFNSMISINNNYFHLHHWLFIVDNPYNKKIL